MKISIIIPQRPYLFEQKSFPYLGPMIVSSALKAEGHEVKLLDFADGYVFEQSDWYAIFATSSDWEEVLVVKKFILDHDPSAKIMVGGPHATYNKQQCTEEFDYVAIGDGEFSAVNIINGDCNEVGYAISGIKAFHAESWTKDIDTFHPDRDITAINLWEYEFYVDGIRATSMITAYSCPYGKCDFCSRPPGNYNTPRYHSAIWCINDIKQIENLGFEALMIYDDEFFTYPQRDAKIIDYLGRSHIKAWRCFARSDYALKNQILVKLAAENGLKEVLIGCESGSDTILNAINKGTTSEMNLKAIKLFHDLGVKVKCTMVIGLPSESKETLFATWEWCTKAEKYVTDWDFTTFTPLPGSKIYDHPELYDIEFDIGNTNVPYKAMNMDSKVCAISTKELTFEQILHEREFLEERFKHGKLTVSQILDR